MKKDIYMSLLNYFLKGVFWCIVALILFYGAITGYNTVYNFILDIPLEEQIIRDVEIEIPKGSSTEDIANILYEEGLIGDTLSFRIRVITSAEYKGKLRYGKFYLQTGMSQEEIIKTLATQGELEETVSFTIPEGYSVQQIINKLYTEGLVDREEFIYAINELNYDYDFYSQIPDSEDRNYKLQGYMFPDTYEVYADAEAKAIVSIMLSKMDQELSELDFSKADELGMTMDEIIIMASIIEKEAKLPEEKPVIAGVLYNRLEEGMPLQVDATIQYIKTHGQYGMSKNAEGEWIFSLEKVYYKDLEIDSPYNTYKYEGLPVGPICNPGIDSIKAALNPEEHDYLYYVLQDEETGKHVFNETHEEHIRDKNKYGN